MKFIAPIIVLLAAGTALAAEAPIGLWSWYETEITEGEIITPATEGYTLSREFLPTGSIYREYVNGVLFRSGSYSYQDVWVDVGADEQVLLQVLTIVVDGQTETCGYNFGTDGSGLVMCWGTHPDYGLPGYPCERYEQVQATQVQATWGGLKVIYR